MERRTLRRYGGDIALGGFDQAQRPRSAGGLESRPIELDGGRLGPAEIGEEASVVDALPDAELGRIGQQVGRFVGRGLEPPAA